MSDDILKTIEHEALWVCVERMPPNMTKEDVNRAVNALASFKDRNKLTDLAIGKSLGYKDSTISLFRRGLYEGDVETLARKAIDLINQV